MIKLTCKDITKLVLPAIRIAVAESLSKGYNYKQEEIAEKLGIVQVAVSKYLNKKYSKKVEKIKLYIESKGLTENITKSIVSGGKPEEIDNEINALCENKEILQIAQLK